MVLDLLLIVWYNGEELRRSFVMDNEPVLYYFVGLPGWENLSKLRNWKLSC